MPGTVPLRRSGSYMTPTSTPSKGPADAVAVSTTAACALLHEGAMRAMSQTADRTPPRVRTPNSALSATPLDNSVSSQYLSARLTSRSAPLERTPPCVPTCVDFADGPLRWEQVQGEIHRLRDELNTLSEICTDFRV